MSPVARKRFDPELFKECDDPARAATQSYLTARGFEVEEHPNRYAQDLIASADGETFLVECEIKKVWKTYDFPYDSVQLPERKKKFFDELTLFFIWNNNLETAMTFWSDRIKHLEPVEVPNKYMYKDEYFFQIPMDLVEQVDAE
jgi:hypothetical protein